MDAASGKIRGRFFLALEFFFHYHDTLLSDLPKVFWHFVLEDPNFC